MKRGTLSWLLLAIGVFSACDANQEALQAVTRGNNEFSSHLYDVIRKSSKGNLIVSPISVATVLAMLQQGARGDTSKAIRSSLHFPEDDQLNTGYRSLLDQLRGDDNITLEMVNRIYPALGYGLNPQFVSNLKTYYSAEPQQLDYTKNVEAAREINNFVSNATRDKIQDLIQSSDLDDRTRLVLVNAIYFKGMWKNQFPKEATQKMDFFTSDTDSVKVDMMRLEADMMYGDIPELDAKAVSLPYKGDRMSMVILLPNKRNGLEEMEDKLKSFSLDKVMEKLRDRKVQLYLPKFKLESTIDLKDPLTQLGLGSIFSSSEADLTGIPTEELKNKEQLYVSKAVQKAFIEVNEEGSEAAAATVLGVVAYSAPLPSEPIKVVTADHPFLFQIVGHGTCPLPSRIPFTPDVSKDPKWFVHFHTDCNGNQMLSDPGFGGDSNIGYIVGNSVKAGKGPTVLFTAAVQAIKN